MGGESLVNILYKISNIQDNNSVLSMSKNIAATRTLTSDARIKGCLSWKCTWVSTVGKNGMYFTPSNQRHKKITGMKLT